MAACREKSNNRSRFTFDLARSRPAIVTDHNSPVEIVLGVSRYISAVVSTYHEKGIVRKGIVILTISLRLPSSMVYSINILAYAYLLYVRML